MNNTRQIIEAYTQNEIGFESLVTYLKIRPIHNIHPTISECLHCYCREQLLEEGMFFVLDIFNSIKPVINEYYVKQNNTIRLDLNGEISPHLTRPIFIGFFGGIENNNTNVDNSYFNLFIQDFLKYTNWYF